MFTITPGTVRASPGEFQSAKSKGPFLSCLGESAWDSGNIHRRKEPMECGYGYIKLMQR